MKRVVIVLVDFQLFGGLNYSIVDYVILRSRFLDYRGEKVSLYIQVFSKDL
jgi:hypothetical protein